MPGISSLLNSGQKALNASQVAIEVTGQNIANVNTYGYSRQRVVFQDDLYVDSTPGQIGTGVRAAEIQRMFDNFVESSYNSKASSSERYNALYQMMRSVESVFNEANSDGVSLAMTKFFQDWQNLTLDASSYPQRQNVLSDTQTLISILRQADSDLDTIQQQAESYIAQDVDTLNTLFEDIAGLNAQLAVHNNPPGQNANGLLDERARKIRALAEIVDINVIDNGGANLIIMDKAGHTFVDGINHYDVALESNKVIKNLTPGSSFDGTVFFSGRDDFEYTVRVVQAGDVSSGSSAAQFQVSLDGGVTWLRSDSGAVKTFSARPEGLSVDAGNLSIYFGQSSNAGIAPTGQLQVGDSFTIVPKSGLFWYQSAATPVNITPQMYFNGQDNTTRVTGGSLAGNFQLRDYNVGRYRERLEALVDTIVWETNRIHSQGAGTKMFTDVTGTYSARDASVALGSDSSGLAFGNKLQSGASTLYVYNSSTGELVSSGFIDFDAGTAGIQLFDPTQHSLADVAQAVNNTFGSMLTASVVNNQLQINAASGFNFGFGTDATGLWAALGVNTFFAGDDARTLTINPLCGSDTGFINAGHINGAGEANQGDNSTALAIAGLRTKEVSIRTSFDAPNTQTIQAYYNSLVGVVGVDTENAKFNYDFENTLAKELNNRQLEVSGVNLDEEMSNLVKFQHSYQAAAKMISTADQMWQTVLGLKQ
ncbi:Flagellar hook-associated protein 1 [Fundidesulfovibrio magnetotacticus]|uniref:Flagellar hook-associated protein 1 n=1 Tax=Fundidesulfovibrio magnetotacticus TaxID=2730080 RepID=A0A6V8LQT2_9BACT|nr:flagellar hook-associated protein FlgK [Fundidesulfovibrio magnetotacticus]GFK92698.1 Flagellar hook-associated protein 1 [Fundidesulfovibrio magnetotacticus]